MARSFKILLAIVLIPLGLGITVVVFEVARVLYLHYPEQNFCSIQDEVYQTMVADLDEWIDTMRLDLVLNDLTWGNITFSVPSGRTYTVSAYDANSYRSYLRVVLKHSWNERHGFLGYIYSTWGDCGLGDKYEVSYLANDIYCYRRKPGYE